jgi:uncharacterized protein (TIGR02466 family)
MLTQINVFENTIYLFEKIEWVDNLNKITNSYIEDKKQDSKKVNLFGEVYHSNSLIEDVNFTDFINFINENSHNILIQQGYDLSNFLLATTELWVQEFSNKGGGYHSPHVHWNGHISGFYFLKCSDKTSFPVFHDPRPGRMMNLLPEKNQCIITSASSSVNLKPKPGTFIFFNSHLQHEFVVDQGIEPFRFIHFNIRAFPKQLF